MTGRGFFRWVAAQADAEKCGRKKFDAVLAAPTAPNLGQLNPPNTSAVRQREAKLHLSPKNYTGCFFTGPPPKKLKYGKLRLGEARCI